MIRFLANPGTTVLRLGAVLDGMCSCDRDAAGDECDETTAALEVLRMTVRQIMMVLPTVGVLLKVKQHSRRAPRTCSQRTRRDAS